MALRQLAAGDVEAVDGEGEMTARGEGRALLAALAVFQLGAVEPVEAVAIVHQLLAGDLDMVGLDVLAVPVEPSRVAVASSAPSSPASTPWPARGGGELAVEEARRWRWAAFLLGHRPAPRVPQPGARASKRRARYPRPAAILGRGREQSHDPGAVNGSRRGLAPDRDVRRRPSAVACSSPSPPGSPSWRARRPQLLGAALVELHVEGELDGIAGAAVAILPQLAVTSRRWPSRKSWRAVALRQLLAVEATASAALRRDRGDRRDARGCADQAHALAERGNSCEVDRAVEPASRGASTEWTSSSSRLGDRVLHPVLVSVGSMATAWIAALRVGPAPSA